MKRFALVALGVSVLTWAAGCCCGPHHGYGGGFMPGACPPAGCQPVMPGPTIVPHTGFYQPPDAIQSVQFAPPQSLVAAPVFYQVGYPQTAMGPLDPLPTY